ncbi:hypothetical protein GCM10022221_59050 [Actinocorallia aurea]
MPLLDHSLAALSTSVYFLGLHCLKTTADDMPVLRGTHPLRLAAALAADPRWTAGAVILLTGAAAQVTALSGLSLAAAYPSLLSGLVVLLVLALAVRGERLTPREWCAVPLLAVSTGLVALAAAHSRGDGAGPSTTAVTVIAIPSLLIPALAVPLGDLFRKGAHRRPLNGVALAISVGLLTGTAELMLKGMADRWTDPGRLVSSPQPYLFLAAAALALAQLQIALQRRRLALVGLVATTTAKAHLLTAALLTARPDGPARTTLMVAGLASAAAAIGVMPRHEPAPPRRASSRSTSTSSRPPAPEAVPSPKVAVGDGDDCACLAEMTSFCETWGVELTPGCRFQSQPPRGPIRPSKFACQYRPEIDKKSVFSDGINRVDS